MPPTPEDIERFKNIFFPSALEKERNVRSKKKRFVHYTSAANAINILKTEEIWMRKSTCMNDYTEVVHGLDCLIKTYKEKSGRKLKTALDTIFSGITAEIENLFDRCILDFQTHTYMACFSEHEDREDAFGRLSMWRAHRNPTGVALVVNSAPFFSQSNAIKVYSSPVAYLDHAEFEQEFEKIAQNIENERTFLQEHDRQLVVHLTFNTLRFAAICTKHPGFAEEKEWRVIYAPNLQPSEQLTKTVEVIAGIPQPIYKIPLRDIPDEGLTGIEIPSLINRVIIGPSEYPQALYEAFSDALRGAGVPDPENKISFSSIPLRH